MQDSPWLCLFPCLLHFLLLETHQATCFTSLPKHRRRTRMSAPPSKASPVVPPMDTIVATLSECFQALEASVADGEARKEGVIEKWLASPLLQQEIAARTEALYGDGRRQSAATALLRRLKTMEDEGPACPPTLPALSQYDSSSSPLQSPKMDGAEALLAALTSQVN